MKKSLRRTLAALICVLLIVGSFSTAFAATLHGGKSKGKAAQLAKYGTSYIGRLTASRQEMWYKFKTQSYDAFYTVQVKNNSFPEHIEVYLLDKYEEEIDRDTWMWKNDVFSSNLKLNKNKWYYIKVVAGSAKAGNVKVTVSCKKDVIGDTRKAAYALTWKKTYTGSINGKNDVDFFKFKAPKTKLYTFTVKNASCSEQIAAYITDRYEEELAKDTWLWKNDTLTSQIKLKKGAWYYIEVDGSSIGNYKVTVK